MIMTYRYKGSSGSWNSYAHPVHFFFWSTRMPSWRGQHVSEQLLHLDGMEIPPMYCQFLEMQKNELFSEKQLLSETAI